MAPIVVAVPHEGPSPPQGPFFKETTKSNNNSHFVAPDSPTDPSAVETDVVAASGRTGTARTVAKVIHNDNIPVTGWAIQVFR